ncbi:MAG: DNA repair protein RadC [Treponema sp.]|nr:DNA repair protein RadC [Treponema sp.]
MSEKPDVRNLVLENGLSYPSEAELIMLIVGCGTKSVPIEKLAEQAVKVILKTNPPELVSELQKIKGIGQTKALTIAAALELGRRMNRTPQAILKKPRDVLPYVRQYAMQPTEHMVSVSLNGMREVISIRVLSVGSGNTAVLRPREIFSEPLKERASAIVLCHNHPSGLCLPSEQDVATTTALYKAALLVGVALLDHLIITKNSYFSFLEHGLLPPDEADDSMSYEEL